MVIIYNINELNAPYPNLITTIGNFDGVHLGHQALMGRVIQLARDTSGQPGLITFEPHPASVLGHGDPPPLITPFSQKMDLIQALGIQVVFCLTFDRALAKMSPEDFVKDILVDKIGVRHVVIGYDYNFGRWGQGNAALLKELGGQWGFGVDALDPVLVNDAPVKSTAVRQLIIDGNVEDIPAYLGRHYQVGGRVEHGFARGGRQLGFPTANVDPKDKLIPRAGVYAVRAQVGHEPVNGVANIGYNPTFGANSLTLEVHLLDFNRDIYDEEITVEFLARLRDEKKFSSPDELITQIKADVTQARTILSA
ncbi:MAG: bifunctional riboflavin kinase/FAD synthetase [Deltaproteobacteria bacterium]|nr:bifunctional riboflavin kinase/FAD synthetase [Deltaproteobacteria bacterium]MBF0523686.1 bifunctional riboflavin kinase/FAD synthetase [Deltaproteobacteria bacterium]